MDEQASKPQEKPTLDSVEMDLFGAVFGFYQRTMTLLRQSSLDDEKLKVVAERINLVFQSITDEVKRSRNWNVAGRLESAYGEIQRLVEELSSKEGSGEEPKPPEQNGGE